MICVLSKSDNRKKQKENNYIIISKSSIVYESIYKKYSDIFNNEDVMAIDVSYLSEWEFEAIGNYLNVLK